MQQEWGSSMSGGTISKGLILFLDLSKEDRREIFASGDTVWGRIITGLSFLILSSIIILLPEKNSSSNTEDKKFWRMSFGTSESSFEALPGLDPPSVCKSFLYFEGPIKVCVCVLLVFSYCIYNEPSTCFFLMSVSIIAFVSSLLWRRCWESDSSLLECSPMISFSPPSFFKYESLILPSCAFSTGRHAN